MEDIVVFELEKVDFNHFSIVSNSPLEIPHMNIISFIKEKHGTMRNKLSVWRTVEFVKLSSLLFFSR